MQDIHRGDTGRYHHCRIDLSDHSQYPFQDEFSTRESCESKIRLAHQEQTLSFLISNILCQDPFLVYQELAGRGVENPWHL